MKRSIPGSVSTWYSHLRYKSIQMLAMPVHFGEMPKFGGLFHYALSIACHYLLRWASIHEFSSLPSQYLLRVLSGTGVIWQCPCFSASLSVEFEPAGIDLLESRAVAIVSTTDFQGTYSQTVPLLPQINTVALVIDEHP